eukprot:scaffold705_cov402-Prasinococcus_capsulatus_cf.AAC.24
MLASYLARALGIATKEGNAGVSKPAEGSGKSGGLPRQSAANVGDAVARSMVRLKRGFLPARHPLPSTQIFIWYSWHDARVGQDAGAVAGPQDISRKARYDLHFAAFADKRLISADTTEKLLAEEAILKRVHLTALKALATSTLLLSGLVALAACALHMNGIRTVRTFQQTYTYCAVVDEFSLWSTTEDIGACLRSRGDAVRASLGMGTRVAEVDVVLPHRPTKKKLSELSDVLR